MKQLLTDLGFSREEVDILNKEDWEIVMEAISQKGNSRTGCTTF